MTGSMDFSGYVADAEEAHRRAGMDHTAKVQQAEADRIAGVQKSLATIAASEHFKALAIQAGIHVAGRAIAEKARAAGVERVAFDRSGYRYHGRIKALAEAAREGGLKF